MLIDRPLQIQLKKICEQYTFCYIEIVNVSFIYNKYRWNWNLFASKFMSEFMYELCYQYLDDLVEFISLLKIRLVQMNSRTFDIVRIFSFKWEFCTTYALD